MSEQRENNKDTERAAAAAFAKADDAFTFGPSFFLGELGRYVRHHCPAPEEHLPNVQIRLADGQNLDLCHIIGVSPRWVMVAIREADTHQNEMAIDLVPFHMVHGVRIRTRHSETASVGFDHGHTPAIISAEFLVESALSHASGPTA